MQSPAATGHRLTCLHQRIAGLSSAPVREFKSLMCICRQFVDFQAVATTERGVRTARQLLALLSDNSPGSLHREKCRRVSIFIETDILCPQYGLIGRLRRMYKAEVDDVAQVLQTLQEALALFNGYDKENWTIIPNQPPFFDCFVILKVFPLLLEILEVPALEEFDQWRDYEVEKRWGQFRRRYQSAWKEDVDNIVSLMGTLRGLALCFSDWPNMDACPGCCSLT